MELEKLASVFEACKVLPLRQSDILVFRASSELNLPEMAEVHTYLEERTGHPRIIILTNGADLAVIRPEDEQPVAKIEAPAPAKRGSAPGAIA
jgi:hypothetical protein